MPSTATLRSLCTLGLGLGLTLVTACDGGGGSEALDAGADAGDGGAQEPDAGDDGGALDDPLGREGAWDARFSIAGFSGMDGLAPRVYDFARTPDGELLAAGYFSWVGNRQVAPLVQLGATGWASFHEEGAGPAPAGGLSAVAVGPAGELALAQYSGPFGGAGESTLWLEDGAGVREIGHFEGTIRALVFFGGELWAAGFFGMENGVGSLAVWDGESWQAPPGGAVDGPVYDLTSAGESLLVAGQFTQVGGIEAQSVASYDGTAWTAFDLENARAFAVLRDGDELYAAGVGVGGVSHFTGSAWEPLGGGLHQLEQDGQGVVSDLVMHQGDLYAIGCFGGAGGASVESPRVAVDSVARWNGTRWEALSADRAPIASSFYQFGVCGFELNEFTLWDMALQRLSSDGERLFIGGAFPGIAGQPSQSIVAYDGTDYAPQGEAGDGLMGSTPSIAIGGSDHAAYVFSGITHAGDTRSASGVYRFDGGWSAVGEALPPGLSCAVTAGGHNLAVTPKGRVFLGCSREDPDAAPPCPDCPPVWPVILALTDGVFTELSGLDQPGTPDDLAIDPQGRLWAVGGVRTGDASGAGWVARWDDDHFTVVEDGFNSMVFRIAFAPGDADSPLVGGAFTQIGDAAHARITRRSGKGWQTLGSELSTAVLALAVGHDDTLYAGTAAESEKYFVLARWQGSAWSELATPARGLPQAGDDTVHQVNALAVVGPRLIVGGSLLPAYDAATPFPEVERNLFVFDGERFAPLGGGVKASSIDSVAVAPDGAWFVGSLLAEAGSGDDRVSSVGIAHWTWAPP